VRKLAVLLVALTIACGTAAGVTISVGSVYSDDDGMGY
jgi:hypothetical protein